MRNRTLIAGLFLPLFWTILAAPLNALPPDRHDAAPTALQQALSNFVQAFDDLDWPRFRACFSANPSIFHPAPPNEHRIDSPEAFDQAWKGVFERIRKSSGHTAPPYMDLKPLDLHTEMLAKDVALVTFHLVDGATLSRRTLVFKKTANQWKIVHIHASNLPLTPSK